MHVKVTDYDATLPSAHVEGVMKALHSIARGIAKAEYNQDAPESDALKQILLSARSPQSISIDKKTAISIFAIKSPVGAKARRYMSGVEICNTLFEDGWREKLASENASEAIALKNDDIRAIIRAANPKISVTFTMPLDLAHQETKSYEDGVRRSQGNRRNNLEMLHWNDPDLYLGAVDSVNNQIDKEAGWRGHVKKDDTKLRNR